MFRDGFRRPRCLVPIDAYFEWQVTDPASKKKRPWSIGLQTGKPFALGGKSEFRPKLTLRQRKLGCLTIPVRRHSREKAAIPRQQICCFC